MNYPPTRLTQPDGDSHDHPDSRPLRKVSLAHVETYTEPDLIRLDHLLPTRKSSDLSVGIPRGSYGYVSSLYPVPLSVRQAQRIGVRRSVLFSTSSVCRFRYGTSVNMTRLSLQFLYEKSPGRLFGSPGPSFCGKKKLRREVVGDDYFVTRSIIFIFD